MSPIRPGDEGISSLYRLAGVSLLGYPNSTSREATESTSLIDSPALAAREWTSVADNDTKTNEYIRAEIPSEVLIIAFRIPL